MIKRKKKPCLDCGEEKIIFGKNLCQNCYRINNYKPIKKVSDNQKKVIEAYSSLRKVFMKKNPICQAKVKCNGNPSTDVHHKAGKATKLLYLDQGKWLAVCRECHNYIEEHPEEAKEKGFSLSRTNQ